MESFEENGSANASKKWIKNYNTDKPEQWFSTMVSRHICVSGISSGVSPNKSKLN